MERNPYAPPVALVADVPPVKANERPPPVAIAVRLIIGSVAVGAMGLPFEWSRTPLSSRGLAAIAFLIVFLVGSAITAGIVLGIRSGRNWVRIVYVALVLLGLIPYVSRVWIISRLFPWQAVIGIIQAGMQLGSVVLLLSAVSSRWFKQARSPT